MKKVLLLLIPFVLLSCSEEEEPMACCTMLDHQVDLKYLNEEGENLLETEDPVQLSDIDVYHKIESEWKGYFEGHHDITNSFRIVEIEGEQHLRVFLSLETDENGISETKLVFPGGVEDIIKAEILVDGGLTTVRKLWFKGELKWEAPANAPRRISIVR